MCDTAGKLIEGGGLFAKNSDRNVNEPQVLEYYPPKANRDTYAMATYIKIEQPEESLGFLLSRPVWLWGGEMGVNECGVAIGNEAVFTKGRYGKSGLTGMDLLRIGLENGIDSKSALENIIYSLEKYGQGGNCGYGSAMYYDNSFLIMDKENIFVLETHNKEWAYKHFEKCAISNELILHEDADKYSGDKVNFKKKNSNFLKSAIVMASSRQRAMEKHLNSALTAKDMVKALSDHGNKLTDPMHSMSAFGPCMHGGALNSSGTTASLICELNALPRIWATGCSAPCLSLYKPWAFGVKTSLPFCLEGDERGIKYWLEREKFHRLAIGKKIPKEFFAQKDELQSKWFDDAQSLDNEHLHELLMKANEEERDFYGRWRGALCEPRKSGKAYLHFWKKNDIRLNTIEKNRKVDR